MSTPAELLDLAAQCDRAAATADANSAAWTTTHPEHAERARLRATLHRADADEYRAGRVPE
jgi:hypothetical protein